MATGNHYKGRWFSRNRRHQPHHQPHNYYKYLIGLLAVVCCQPALAEDNVGVTANPQASISGAVANQAVQINQGSLSTQSFSQGHYCNGAVLSISPYYLQTESHFNEPLPLNRNFGGQLTISVPLDGGAVETCKALGRVALQKQLNGPLHSHPEPTVGARKSRVAGLLQGPVPVPRVVPLRRRRSAVLHDQRRVGRLLRGHGLEPRFRSSLGVLLLSNPWYEAHMRGLEP